MTTTTTRRPGRLVSGLVAGVVLFGASLVGAAAPAQAAERDGICDEGEVCYYHDADFRGAMADLPERLASYGEEQPTCYEFNGPGAGSGECVKNNAGSVWNNTRNGMYVFYNSGYSGLARMIPSGGADNLGELAYENASHAPIE